MEFLLGSGVGVVPTLPKTAVDEVKNMSCESLMLFCLRLPSGTCAGTVDVVEYDWGTDAKHLLQRRKSSGSGDGTSYDLVICADCVYASASVEPLLASLCQVCMIYFARAFGCKRCTRQTTRP